ncbi:MAG: hypothetical protein ACYTAF_08415, partial [Planctomycetota bacterium]
MDPRRPPQEKKKWGFLLLLLLLLAVGGGLVYRFLIAPAELEPTTDRVPMVAAALRGRVEYLDPLTAEWRQLQRGDFIEEGMQIRVEEGGALTLISEDNFSVSAGGDSLFMIRRASKKGDGLDIELGLERGRLTARVGEGALGSGV